MAPPSGGSSSATVTPGQAATYTLSVGGEGGMSGSVSFTCTGAPSEATCTVSPNPATVGNSAMSVTVTVSTTAPSLAGPRLRIKPTTPILPKPTRLLMLLLLLTMAAWAIARRHGGVVRFKAALLPLGLGLILTLALAACGGGGGGGGGGNQDPGTPTGTYSLTITGTTGTGALAVTHSTTLKLVVN